MQSGNIVVEIVIAISVILSEFTRLFSYIKSSGCITYFVWNLAILVWGICSCSLAGLQFVLVAEGASSGNVITTSYL